MFVYSCFFCIYIYTVTSFFQIASIIAFVLCVRNCWVNPTSFFPFPFRKGCKTADEIIAMPAVQVVSQIEASKSSVQEIKNKRQFKEELGPRVCV